MNEDKANFVAFGVGVILLLAIAEAYLIYQVYTQIEPIVKTAQNLNSAVSPIANALSGALGGNSN